MFTGIVEEIGIIKEFSKGNKSALMTVECKKVIEDTAIGDSISVNGVCQTVIKFSPTTFSAEVSSETLAVTSFKNLKIGDKVNLERALTLTTRLGGHMVSGHIDGLAKVKNIQKMGEFYNLRFEIDKNLTKYVVKKGSAALDGISLTVADVKSNEFSVAVIPHTFENTALSGLKIGSFVNFEADILAKYVENFLSTRDNGGVNENFLKENGFM